MTGHLSDATIAEFDDLDGAARTETVAHATDCAACRARLLAVDPSRAFALLADLPVPLDRLARFDAGLARELDRLDGRPVPRRALRFASIAASIALAALVVGVLGRDSVERTPGLARGVAPAEPAYGQVELLSSPGEAQVLDLRVGGTQVVMIFDKDLEL